jgi:hypothetical protein
MRRKTIKREKAELYAMGLTTMHCTLALPTPGAWAVPGTI